ncbi:MAG: PAS domain S-box protein [Candidatus Thorarchaeota archaeon]
MEQGNGPTKWPSADLGRQPPPEFYKALIDFMNDGVVVTDNKNDILFVNQRFCEMVGFRADELVGSDLLRLLSPKYKEVLTGQSVDDKTKRVPQYELEWIHWTGEAVSTIVSESPLIGNKGETVGFLRVVTDITGIVRTSQALVHSEEKYRTLFNESPIGIVIVRPDGVVTDANRAALQLVAAPAEQYDDLTKAGLTLLQDPRLRDELQRCVQTKSVVTGEHHFVSCWNRRVHLRYKMYPRLDNEGNVHEVLCTFDDIGEMRRMQDRLKESLTLLGLVMNTIPALVFWKDRSHVYMGCNANFAVTSGAGRPESIAGKTDRDLGWTEAQAEAFVAADERVMTQNTPEFHVVERVSFADGRVCWWEISRVPLVDSDGNVIGVLGTAQDITQRKMREDEMIKSESRYRKLADNSPQGIMILGEHGILYANSAFAKIVMRQVDELVKMHIDEVWEMVHSEDRETLRENLLKGLAGRPLPTTQEYRLIRTSGEVRWVESYSSVVDYAGAPALQIAVIDVTDRRRVEREMKSASDRAYIYLDIMTHDIRNQLQVIASASALLRESYDETTRSSFFDIISGAVKKCSRLIDEVRATEHLMNVPLVERSLREVLDSCVMALSSRSENVQFETHYDVTEAIVEADEYLELLLTNILINAIEHNPKPVKRVWVTLSEEAQSYVVTVADDGPGVPDSTKAVLLDKARRFGGFGLHQSSQIAEKYGGRIEIGDRVPGHHDQGAEFRIVIPRSQRKKA